MSDVMAAGMDDNQQMNNLIPKSTVSRASQLLKDMILESYKHKVVKYQCGTIIEYLGNDEPRDNCPICCAGMDVLHITFLEGGQYGGNIYKDGKYD